eukprot:EG_transcript_10543
MADVEEWLFDSISQFLRSPWWGFPIQTFIDENCLSFEGSEESSLAQTAIHESFRELVDKVLGEHLSSLGISAEQFISACDKGKNKELHALVSEYILALDDFVVFKKMMEKRNVELELEALRCLKLGVPLQLDGVVPDEDPAEALRRQREEEERALLEAVIAQSIQEIDLLQKQLEMEEAQLEHALAISLALAEEDRRKAELEAEKLAQEDAQKAEEELKRIKEEHSKNVEALQASYETEKADIVHRKTATISGTSRATASAFAAAPPPPPEPEPAPEPAETGAAAAKLAVSQEMTPTLGNVRLGHLGHAVFGPQKTPLPGIANKPRPPAPAPASAEPAPVAQPAAKGPNSDEIAKRAEYLKQQRQRLLDLKKQERTKELEEYEKQQAEKGVPKPGKPELDEQQREMRLALARRFKEDLIHETKQAALRAEQ